MKTAIFSAAAVVTVFAATASAHHSFAMFDQTKEVDAGRHAQGTAVDQPAHLGAGHGQGPRSGKDVEWSIEGGSPNGLPAGLEAHLAEGR